jgi:uncharacterized protein (TIGR02001 family)
MYGNDGDKMGLKTKLFSRLARTALYLGIISLLVLPARAEEAAAEEEEASPISLIGSVTFVSDYLYRGISQTDNDPAVQGFVELGYAAHPLLAPYVSVWASNIDFPTETGLATDRASLEVDLTAGFRGGIEIAEGYKLIYDANVIYYYYPDASGAPDTTPSPPGGFATYDFYEWGVAPGLETPLGTVSVGLRWSDDFFFNTGDAYYLYGALTVPVPVGDWTGLPFSVSLIGHVGRQWIHDNSIQTVPGFPNLNFGAPDYTEWQIGGSITYDPWGLGIGVAYADTNIGPSECFIPGFELCEGRTVVSATKTF